jgi:two-component system, cell cycle sensor histidine kinase and response regulator CckA
MNTNQPSIGGNSEVLPAFGPHGERLYRQLFELMPGSVLLLDARGFVLDVNPAFCRQIGFSRNELVGGHVSRFSQSAIEVIDRNLARLMAGEVLEHQVTNVQKDGSPRHYELRERAITLPDGSRGVLALANDITERMRVERDRFEMERQLLHADKLKSLGVLTGGIAHDFNNLLATITGNIELASLDLDAGSPVQPMLKEAASAAQRATDLTRQMLAFSGRGRFVVSEVDLSDLVGEMAELLSASISKKASLHLNLASELPFIDGDAPQLQQVVVNLVTNASDALSEKPGLITITTCVRECDAEILSRAQGGNVLTPGCYVVFEVRDTGCGMDESTQQQLFDPFFTTKFTGRGLGMSAVLGVVRGHNGGLLVSSQRGLGTVVSVLFPAKAYKPATAAKPLTPPAPSTPSTNAPLTGTVLVVDDEAPLRLLVEQILKRMGLRVLSAGDGEEAIACFREHAQDITFVILDLTMPTMDGVKTLSELRRLQPEVKAVLTSGYDVESLNPGYAQAGFAAFIRKPFQVESLITLARRMCVNNP